MSDANKEKFSSIDKLPDDPLAIPPPYWRGGGAIFHILDSLRDVSELLRELLPVHGRTEHDLDAYYEKYAEKDAGDPELEEFSEICDELWELEHKIKLRCQTAILMSAIEAEDDINMFCVFNLPKDVAESIEELSPAKKLLIASTLVGKQKVKSDTSFEAIGKLVSWRNAFAHGHCVDRPVKSLRHNHLLSPTEYPGVPDTLVMTGKFVSYYVKISDYLRSISINPYTAGRSTEVDEIREYLRGIGCYHFEGNSQVYTVTWRSHGA